MKLPKFTKPYRLRDYNFTLVTLVFILSVIGILVVGSAKQVYQSRQVLGVMIGIVFMMIVTFIDYVWLLDFYWFFYGFSIFILGLVLGAGKKVGGATRWIDLGFTTFQPSEMAKILLILFFANFLM